MECRKWPDDPHWEFDAVHLGVDAHGTWVGITEGTVLASPSRSFHAAADHVTLVPHDAWWLATFYGEDRQRPFDVYVDIATPAVWHGEALVRSVDLDLDVIRGTTGRVWVDDEDEFAAHRVQLGYPEDVVGQALASCEAGPRRRHRRAWLLRRRAPALAGPAQGADHRSGLVRFAHFVGNPVETYLDV